MTGRRPARSRGATPLWRDEYGQQAPTPTPGPSGTSMPAQRAGRRQPEGARRASGRQSDSAYRASERQSENAYREPGRRVTEQRRTGAQRRSGEGRPAAAPRAERRRSAAASSNRMPAVLPALGLPVLGALADELFGGGLGWLYSTCAVLGAGMAALVATRRGWWWIVSGAPVVTLTVACAVDYLARSDRYQGAGLATQGLRLVSGQFWPMVAAVAAALLATVVRTRRTRKAHHG
ncbi:DUF6542 domain-containing protein [Kitasatospora griseola]|uniref:DUF6542 domain-containing protein n=2 Tax=Kitasatospora griseola TaxID=2064 RepID=UPI0038560EE2